MFTAPVNCDGFALTLPVCKKQKERWQLSVTTVSSRAPHASLASSDLSAPKQCKLMHAKRKYYRPRIFLLIEAATG
jgi:hypothetical protein